MGSIRTLDTWRRLPFSRPLFASALLVGTTVVLASCGEDGPTEVEEDPGELRVEEVVSGEIEVEENPSGIAPLTAELRFETRRPVSVETTVQGSIPLARSAPGFATEHRLPVLGLYPGAANSIELRLIDEEGAEGADTLRIDAPALPDFLPEVEIALLKNFFSES